MTPIPIDEFRVTRLLGGDYEVQLRSGRYEYAGRMEGTLAGLGLVMSGALKFFGIKYGLIVVERDGLVRNREKAREQGFA